MLKAIFLDRDGVINKEKNYVYKVEDFEFIDGIFNVCEHFYKKGYLIFIITNQSGIARKYFSQKDFDNLTRWMIKEFKKKEIKIQKVYFCPHHPEFTGECNCRKPNPGMILKAKNKYNIDLNNSILIGDKNSDIEAGINAGIKNNYLIRTGHKIVSNQFDVPILNNILDILELHNE